MGAHGDIIITGAQAVALGQWVEADIEWSAEVGIEAYRGEITVRQGDDSVKIGPGGGKVEE